MKRNIFIAVALFATMTANAQNIAVVNPSNETSVYQTLDEAVTGADPGSIIYLPGGGVQIKNDTKITKKLTIMGVSHRGDTDNADDRVKDIPFLNILSFFIIKLLVRSIETGPDLTAHSFHKKISYYSFGHPYHTSICFLVLITLPTAPMSEPATR